LKCGSALLSSDRHKTETERGPDLYKALAYDPEELGAGARHCSKFKNLYFVIPHEKAVHFS